MAGDSDQVSGTDSGPQSPLLVKFATEPPLIFADGVLSQTYAPGIAKFFLYRIDSDPHAKGAATIVPAVQIAMPATQFAHMVTFFESRLSVMIEQGIVTQDFVNAARASWVGGAQNAV